MDGFKKIETSVGIRAYAVPIRFEVTKPLLAMMICDHCYSEDVVPGSMTKIEVAEVVKEHLWLNGISSAYEVSGDVVTKEYSELHDQAMEWVEQHCKDWLT